MNNKKYRKEYLGNIALALLFPVWMGIAPAWYSWFAKPVNGQWMKSLYGLLDGNVLVNIPLCVVLTFAAYCWGKRIWNDFDVRLYRPIMLVLGGLILYFGDNVVYANVFNGFDYRAFLTLLLALLLLTMIVKIVRKTKDYYRRVGLKKRNKNEKEEGKDAAGLRGFTDDKAKGEIPSSLKKYAGKIVQRLLATDIGDHSFALGVTGEWGVGKTTFLDELKSQAVGRVDIVEFNPWMCSSPDQVISDFFASLRHQLSGKYSTLSKSIKEYAKYVNNVTVNPYPSLSLETMLPVNQESLFERKKILSEKFSRLPRPVMVVIDDVDRLERDEVFEVLRLIRNTADLSNVIYMVAYDKEYVTNVLEEKEIKDSTAYLEKIFQVEVHLPKVEEHLVWETLSEEIKAQSMINNYAERLFQRFEPDDKELILHVLDNYRRAKRFAREFMLIVDYLRENAKKEFKGMDLFWLELLQMYDKKTYDVLADEPGKLLFSEGEKFRIREGILGKASEDDLFKFEGAPFWKEKTPKILEKMFGKNINTTKLSICFTENYDKFFTLSVSPFRLSVKEMSSLFETGANPDELVDKWVDSGKYFSSIVYQFKQVNVFKLNEEQLPAYLRGLLCFNMKVAPYRSTYVWEVKKMLLDERFVGDMLTKAHNIVMGWFDERMNDDKLLPSLSQMLNQLYITIEVTPAGGEETMGQLLISNEEVEALLVTVMKKHLANHPEVTALNVMSEEGVTSYIFGNCCVAVRNAMATEDYCEYKQIAFETVIEHFASKAVKPSVVEYEEAYKNMFKEEIPEYDGSNDDDLRWVYDYDSYENKMQEYFGSRYDMSESNTLTEFKEKCFVGEVKEQAE